MSLLPFSLARSLAPRETSKILHTHACVNKYRSELSLSSLAILVLGSVVFALLAKTGGRLLDNVEGQEKAAIEQAGDEKMEWGAAGATGAHATSGTMVAPTATLPVAI